MFVDEKALPEAPVKKLKPWQEHCLKAADYIDQHGWCQFRAKHPNGSVCMLGALCAVICGSPLDTSFNFHEFHATRSQLMARLERGTVSAFNDVKGRTKEEVTALLRSMAD